MKKTLLPLFILIILLNLCFLLSSQQTLASAEADFQQLNVGDVQTLYGTTADKAEVQKTGDITLLASAIVKALLGLVGIIFFILIIYGGYSWMTAGGNDEKVLKAKKLIIRAVIGLAIVASAYSIAYFVTQAIE